MFCHNCGTKLDDNAKSCYTCGTIFATDNKSITNTDDRTYGVHTGTSSTGTGKSFSESVKPHPNTTTKKSNKGLTIGLICGGIVLLIILIVAGASIFGGDDNSPSSTPSSSISANSEQITEYIQKADKFAAEGKYDEAIATLETAEQLYGNTAKITEKKNEYLKSKGMVQLAILEADAKYKEAIEYINLNLSKISNDPDIVSKKNLYATKYKEGLVSEANTVLLSNGYNDAVEIIQDGLKVLPDDSELNAKLVEYEAYRPIPLQDLTVTDSNDGYDFKEGAVDPRGESNANVMVLESYVEFFLEGKYSKFEATLDPTQYFSTSQYADTKLQIYADKKLVYTSPVITYKTDDLKISANINNAEYITIEVIYVGTGSSTWNAGSVLLYDATVAK